MIIGLGTDLVEVGRMSKAYAKFGDRLCAKILTDEELDKIRGNTGTIGQYLASRFAAKEAAVKALGTGFSRGIGPKCVEIYSNAAGRPFLRFAGPALEFAQGMNIGAIHLSISHERSIAFAAVILEGM